RRRVVSPFPSRHALAPFQGRSRGHRWGKATTYPAVRISGARSITLDANLAAGNFFATDGPLHTSNHNQEDACNVIRDSKPF
ncbi:hypothetical protein, partial [Aromatoleum aromaticum]|uniref:hypothetical protein n=1 Tax=Aromatoleum aromaticum TaxID=551760 RepID=UPI001B7CF0CB